jgi:hypothetical protein
MNLAFFFTTSMRILIDLRRNWKMAQALLSSCITTDSETKQTPKDSKVQQTAEARKGNRKAETRVVQTRTNERTNKRQSTISTERAFPLTVS